MSDEPDDPKALEFLRTYLTGRDIACPKCNYNLRDQRGNRCPECGEEIVLRLALVEPKLGSVIAGIVGLSFGAGMSGLLLIYIVLQAYVFRRGSGVPRLFVWLNLGGFIVEGIPLLLWAIFWRNVRRQSLTMRVLMVLSCWLLTLANIIVFFSVYIR